MFITCALEWDGEGNGVILKFVSVYDKIETALEKLSKEGEEFCFEAKNGNFFQHLGEKVGEIGTFYEHYELYKLKYYFKVRNLSDASYKRLMEDKIIVKGSQSFQYQKEGDVWVDNHIYIGEQIGLESGVGGLFSIKFFPVSFCELSF